MADARGNWTSLLSGLLCTEFHLANFPTGGLSQQENDVWL